MYCLGHSSWEHHYGSHIRAHWCYCKIITCYGDNVDLYELKNKLHRVTDISLSVEVILPQNALEMNAKEN